MTRADAPRAEFEYRSFGAPGAERTVFVLREGAVALLDPEPSVTSRRDVRVVAVAVTADDLDDPSAYRGATPAAAATAAIAALIDRESHDRPVGLVGVAAAGELALMLAARLGDRVDRLALVAVAEPVTMLDRDEVGDVLGSVSAPTLIVNGRGDPDAASSAAQWHGARLPSARVDVVPAPREPDGAPSVDPRLSLSSVWDRVLSHVAPDTMR